MNIHLGMLTLLMFFHWFGDFQCQTSWMGTNKGKRVLPLFVHCCVYGSVLYVFGCIAFDNFASAAFFAGANAAIHFVVDFVSSKATTWAWNKEYYRAFFNIIGLDQFIHFSCLSWLYWFTTVQ